MSAHAYAYAYAYVNIYLYIHSLQARGAWSLSPAHSYNISRRATIFDSSDGSNHINFEHKANKYFKLHSIRIIRKSCPFNHGFLFISICVSIYYLQCAIQCACFVHIVCQICHFYRWISKIVDFLTDHSQATKLACDTNFLPRLRFDIFNACVCLMHMYTTQTCVMYCNVSSDELMRLVALRERG